MLAVKTSWNRTRSKEKEITYLECLIRLKMYSCAILHIKDPNVTSVSSTGTLLLKSTEKIIGIFLDTWRRNLTDRKHITVYVV